MIMPASISPIIGGNFSLLSRIGAKSMMNNTREKIITGFFRGKVKSKPVSKII
jgi:hypothetical protein